MPKMPEVLLLGKQNDPRCESAVDLLLERGFALSSFIASRGTQIPPWLDDWSGDYIISYLFPHVVKRELLKRARVAAINLHPGPPEYPGIGCTNFALYHGVTQYGVTCHHMLERVDTGPIIAVRRFDVHPNDTVMTLTQRCYDALWQLFRDIADILTAECPLPVSAETWTRPPFTRRELNELCRITPDMPAEEVYRRIRAVTFPGAPGAFIEIHGARFILSEESNPI